jgi:hypothetical protein
MVGSQLENVPQRRIDGNILGPIPLLVEDNQRATISNNCLYLHTSKSNEIPSEDPGIVNISVGAVYELGGFYTVITPKVGKNMFRKLPDLSIENWYDIVTNLFPIDNITEAHVSETDYSIIDKYQLSGRILVEKDSQGDYVDVVLTISIKTKDAIPITIGSLDLKPVDFKEEPSLNQGDLFDWLQLSTVQNSSMASELRQLNQKVEYLELLIYKLKKSMETSKSDYELIINDLETKFYQVLNSKKDYIWRLLNEKTPCPSDRIAGLNSHLLTGRDKLHYIDESAIKEELDPKFLKARKLSTEKADTKRRKTARKRNSPDSSQQDTDDDKTNPVKRDESEVLPELHQLKDDSSLGSNHFRFTRSLRSTNREILNKDLDDDENHNENSGGKEENEELVSSQDEVSDLDGDDYNDDDDDGDDDDRIHPAQTSQTSISNSKIKQELDLGIPSKPTMSSNEIVEDSLPEREMRKDECQSQETDYDSEDSVDGSDKSSTNEKDKGSTNQNEKQHVPKSSPSTAARIKLENDSIVPLQTEIQTDYEDSDD